MSYLHCIFVTTFFQYNLNFPFYYTREYKWFKVNSDKSIIEQIYDELNTFSDKYTDCLKSF